MSSNVIYRIHGSGTCAGKKIENAACMFSSILMENIEDNLKLSEKIVSEKDLVKLNSVNVILSVSVVESLINEMINLRANFEDSSEKKFWVQMRDTHLKKHMWQKWDLIADEYSQKKWSNENEPFKAFSCIKDLRNELVHYKSKYLGKDENPTSKISNIADELGCSSSASFIEDDVSTWVHDILSNEDLALYIWVCIDDMRKEVMKILLWHHSG